MDRGLQWSWLLVGLVTTVGVIIAGSIRRERPKRLPTEHVVAASVTAVLAWETGVAGSSSLSQVGLGSAENSLWILGHVAVAVAGLVALVLVVRRQPLGVPLAIGVCVMRLAAAGTGVASIVGVLQGDPNGAALVAYTAAQALPALLALLLFVSPYIDARLGERRRSAAGDEPTDVVAEGRP